MGNVDGISKWNADGSFADEGQSTPPGTFRTDGFLSDSVRSIKYGTDDRIYFNDWVGNGKVWACDMKMTTSQLIINADLQPTLSTLSSGMYDMDITDLGTTNGQPANLKPSEEMQLVDSNNNVIGAPSAPDPDTDGFNACTWAGTCVAPSSS